MQESTIQKASRALRRLMVAGTIFISLVGASLHFVYEWTGRSPVAGVFAAINESVWEHMKLTYLPILAWYLVSYHFGRIRDLDLAVARKQVITGWHLAESREQPTPDGTPVMIREHRPVIRWMLAASTALLVAHLFIPFAYYTLSGGFDIHSLLVDIICFVIAIALGQALALHVYKHSGLGRFSRAFAIAVPLVLLAAHILFTFAPPHLPLFLDPQTETYGIWMVS